jgi:hypothetical protein
MPRNFNRHQLVLVLGKWLWSGQERQKQPSTNTAIRAPPATRVRRGGDGYALGRPWRSGQGGGAAMMRHEVRAWLVEFLLDKVREDRYPSPTHLALIEKWISRDRVHDYLRVLIDKVEQGTFPSIPMLRRIQRVAECLPRSENGYSREPADAEAPPEATEPRENVPTPSPDS